MVPISSDKFRIDRLGKFVTEVRTFFEGGRARRILHKTVLLARNRCGVRFFPPTSAFGLSRHAQGRNPRKGQRQPARVPTLDAGLRGREEPLEDHPAARPPLLAADRFLFRRLGFLWVRLGLRVRRRRARRSAALRRPLRLSPPWEGELEAAEEHPRLRARDAAVHPLSEKPLLH